MTTLIIILAAGAMLALAILMTLILGWANQAFHVEIDPKVERVRAALPGANCGGCGYVNCDEYAEAAATREAPPDKCPVGGSSCAQAVAAVLGLELDASWPQRPVVHCGATSDKRLQQYDYLGEPGCAAANLVGGVQGCTYGCLGLGDCEASCPFDAIHIIDGLAVVDYDKCTGCGKCERACPRHIISLVPFQSEQMLVIKCSNADFGKDVKAVCKTGCIGCKACMRMAGALIHFKGNLPIIDYENYDPGQLEDADKAVEKCPMKGLVFIGKPSEKDLAATKDQETPAVVEPDFKTTVDQTEYRG